MSKKYSIFITALFCGFIGLVFVANLIKPDQKFSQLENRYLAQKPTLNEHSFDLWNGSFTDFLHGDSRGDFFSGKFMADYEKYITDQFVGRDGWIAAKAAAEVLSGKQENNGVYIGKNDTLIPRFDQPDAQRVQNNLNYVNNLVDNVDIPVYFGLIPGKVSVWQDRLPDHAPNASEEDILTQAKESTKAGWVDVDSAMRDHASEDIYYRLDHHWTSLGAYYGYAAILEAMGKKAPALEAYEKKTVSTEFDGTTFSTSGVRWMKSDSIDVYVPGDGVTVTVFPQGTAEEGALYHEDKLTEKDKYTFFLGGNTPLAVVKTPQADAPKVLVIRDSYADSLTPFLTDSFSEIHLFDPRYNKTPVSRYIAENGIDQVLVLYSVANFVSDSNLFVLSK
ncbi:MAG: hypothetical protein EOM52_10730 [Clostridia bacterium]|nr:hypothetical protein [Clostridia bacterium]